MPRLLLLRLIPPHSHTLHHFFDTLKKSKGFRTVNTPGGRAGDSRQPFPFYWLWGRV